MVKMSKRNTHSLETILTYETGDISDWSVIWSTTHIPGMDNATGAGGSRKRQLARRRIRLGSLALGAFLTMHCRVAASALTGGVFVFMLFLIMAVAILANPLRHFEVYLGQWSISGPGRAFRILPMFDGIGIAICINAIVRAIVCCSIAAIAALYFVHTVADAKLPFTYCRDFDLKPYDPIMKDLKSVKLQESRLLTRTGVIEENEEYDNLPRTTVGLSPYAWRNFTTPSVKCRKGNRRHGINPRKPRQIEVCRETYSGRYPVLYSTPAYNFFYVEVVQFRGDRIIGQFNMPLVFAIVIVWTTMWGLMVLERFRYGRLVWNNVQTWFVVIPWIWAVVLALAAVSNLETMNKSLKRVLRIGAKEIVPTIGDALEVSLYIHAVSVGTETILGKGLNHYASGHIDPLLDSENVWHSALLLMASALHCGAAALCALVDSIQPSPRGPYSSVAESTLWIMPMYSKCASLGNYSHVVSSIVFGGLMFSYMTVAFVMLKTALHIIFEYRVKLVFMEQIIVATLILTCTALSLLFATNGGIALLESVDSLMSGIAVSYVCLLELVGLIYVYRSHDFISDMNVSMDDSNNPCAARIGIQWQIIPFITLAHICLKAAMLARTELPSLSMCIALTPLVCVMLAVPARGLHNAIVFMRPAPRHGT